MPCSAGCGHDPADPDHVMLGEGAGSDMLTSRIDIDGVDALNCTNEERIRDIFKPWDERNEGVKFVTSDADEQMIIRIPFTGNVKLRSIFVKGGRGDVCPMQVKVYSNIPGLDFDSAEAEKPTQVLELIDSRDAVEYPVPAARYPAVSHLTLYITQNGGASDGTQIFYLGFKGEFSKRAGRPGQIVYEAQANPADHAKLPGMSVGMHSNLGS